MQGVLGASAAAGFQLDLGVKLGIFYYTLLHLTREKLMRNDTETIDMIASLPNKANAADRIQRRLICAVRQENHKGNS